jgi:lipopolysaccharide export system protein LptC
MRWVLLSALVATSAALGGCGRSRSAEGSELLPQLVLQGVRFRVDRDGANRAQGTAELVALRRDTGAVAVRGLAMTLFGSEGEVLIKAPLASGLLGERRFSASGGLTALRRTDLAVTDAAWYQPGPRGTPGLARGDGPVVLTGPGYRVTGTGFTLDPATRELTLRGGARLVSGLKEAR